MFAYRLTHPFGDVIIKTEHKFCYGRNDNMPLTNIFLWVVLVLMAVLSFYLLNSYRREERDAYQRYSVMKSNRTNAREGIRNPVRSAKNLGDRAKKPVGFFEVGQGISSRSSHDISFMLPARPFHSIDLGQQEKAAVADCQSCA
jgi:hypothetical protein